MRLVDDSISDSGLSSEAAWRGHEPIRVIATDFPTTAQATTAEVEMAVCISRIGVAIGVGICASAPDGLVHSGFRRHRQFADDLVLLTVLARHVAAKRLMREPHRRGWQLRA